MCNKRQMKLEKELGILFPEKKIESIKVLIEDPDSKKPVMREIGREIGRQLRDIPSVSSGKNYFDQVVCILSTANFDFEDDELFEVSRIIISYSGKSEVLPYVIEHLPKVESMERIVRKNELGEKCFIGLSLFYDKLQNRYERQSAPHPDFYREVGISAFRTEGFPSVAKNFRNWEYFVRETFSWMNE